MARGFLSGLIVGGVVSVGAAGIVSVISPPPAAPLVGDAAPGVATPERVTAPGSGEAGSNADRTLQVSEGIAPAPAPDPDTLSAIDDATLDTAGQPETGGAEDLAAPAEGREVSGVALEADEPVLPNPQALAPMEPQAADGLSISTEPAQPPQPQAETESAAFDSPEGVDESPEAPEAEASAPAGSIGEAAPEAPATAEAPEIDIEAPAAPAPPPEEPQQETAALAPDATGPTVGTPVTSLIDREGAVAVRRPGTEEEQAVTEAQTASVPAIERFAEPFDVEEGKPLMSIVLIDGGNTPVSGAAGLAALSSFPYPLTFAVDASLPDAAERMKLYRAEGFEVLAMIDLPEGAQPSDVETTLGTLLPALDQVVGILGAPSTNLQVSREVSDQVAAFLAQGGHGWVTQPKGLNTAATLARREGVPAAPVFRDFDSKGQTAVVIRRFLDQAAFKAGQESGVIMLGRMQPETISALLLWGLQDRAGQVSLAPISATLRGLGG
ncbi:MAG: divergent polysaccharide deacetylase family protein [Sulfitobacter sp.]|nr:divergent polysaccharide deacetylase family protein [Sulfitobacter sp.]